MNQQVKKGKAPKSVDSVDTANTNVKGEFIFILKMVMH